MELQEAKDKFIHTWAQLGSSWGINKTMAQIHALLLVSANSLSTDDVMEQLKISRGNANMNLRALIDWGLIYKDPRIGERMEFFRAEKNIDKVARNIARERRKREIEPVLSLLADLNQVEIKESAEALEFKKVTKDIAEFSESVDGFLDKFSKTDKNWFYGLVMKIMK